ncbi:MAG: serine hydrolase [Candidatus Omnitrophota bacterium]
MKKIILIIAITAGLVIAGKVSYDVFGRAIECHWQAVAAQRAGWARLKEDVTKMAGQYKGDVALVIKDLGTGARIEINENMEIPSASLVKIPIMLAVFSEAKAGRITLNDAIELRQSDKTDGSGVLKNALTGPSYKIEALVSLMITQSDNTAANMLINRLGMDELNQSFKKFGLKHTNLSRRMMDFKSRKYGIENYTTAADMAHILEELYRGSFISKGISNSCLEYLSEQKINDRIPKKLPSGVTVAHKTGLENGVCHDVGIVYTDKGNFIICALIKHRSSTARQAKRLIAYLSLSVYNYYNAL